MLVCQSETGCLTEGECWGPSCREEILGCLVAGLCGGIGMVALVGCQYTSVSITEGYWTAFQDCGKHQWKIN